MMRPFIYWKKILYPLLIALSFVGIQDFCHRKTHGFTLAKAKSSYNPEHRNILCQEDTSTLQPILNQSFYFLEKGLQCYVFISEDQKYVLKLFRWKELEPRGFSRFFPSSWNEESALQKKQKKSLDFTSYQLAWDQLREETGLIFLHLEKTKGLNLSLHLYDPILVRHIVPADDVEFILQKKVEPFVPFFEKKQEHKESLYPFFVQLAQLLRSRVEKGISDSDISLQYNMGVSAGGPVLFDIGNLSKTELTKHSCREQLDYESRLILGWLQEKDPMLAQFFQKQLYAKELPCEKP